MLCNAPTLRYPVLLLLLSYFPFSIDHTHVFKIVLHQQLYNETLTKLYWKLDLPLFVYGYYK